MTTADGARMVRDQIRRQVAPSMASVTLKIDVALWIGPFVVAMTKLSQTERFKATISTFILDHGMTVQR